MRVKGHVHDFGTYYEVKCVFDDNTEAAVEYAYRCEAEASAVWDAEARRELGLKVTP